ncbi:N-acetylmuramoyl-L-alanine amidase domain-containing protein [Aspergillus granulosus]|uniref:N-acetylmuramoyl-L-alanine amidase domain-containing protein n=1 Tax=Aspergillus granulosus TaxID=176169 RepID=A0ABR4H8L4_9EURO
MASKLLTYMVLGLTLISTVQSMYFVSRDEWNAEPPRGSYTAITNPKGVKVHYVGPEYSSREHSKCGAYMKSIQEMHLANTVENYMDIAYSLGVCEHGYVFDGRGKGHRSGANGGTTLNADHYAVLAFLGKAGLTEPTDDQILGIQDSIAYLRRAGAGNEIAGHRDGYATECPGEALYALVKDDSLDPGTLYDGGEHEVQQGETLDDIAEEYNVPKRYIITANDISENGNITVGDVLKIPARGVPLGNTPPSGGGGGGGGGEEYEPFPGASFFKGEPSSPIVKAMGERLVEEGCGRYPQGPSEQWGDADLQSYKCWQEQLGYTGADADGWPGQTSWDKLKVPAVSRDATDLDR